MMNQIYGICISVASMSFRRARTHVTRNATLFYYIVRFLLLPFIWSFGNWQKGMADKVTAARETSPFSVMTDLGIAFVDVPGDPRVALFRHGLAMACGAIIAVAVVVQLAFMEVEMNWLSKFDPLNVDEDYIISLLGVSGS